jgi:predicted Fe-Mo cluster-binding NifX family protein
MKIVLTASSPNIDAAIDSRFGRAAYLLVVDTDTNKVEGHENPGMSAPGGAGIKAAQFVANVNAKAAISGDFGPHAFDALQAAQIKMYIYGNCRTVSEAIERFKAGQLQPIGVPTRGECDNGHQGLRQDS